MNFITSIAAWICVPFVVIYFTMRLVVFGIIELFVPNKNTKKVPNTMHNTVSSRAQVTNAITKDGETMTDARFNEINDYLIIGFKKDIPLKMLATMMMADLKVTAEEADQMQKRLKLKDKDL